MVYEFNPAVNILRAMVCQTQCPTSLKGRLFPGLLKLQAYNPVTQYVDTRLPTGFCLLMASSSIPTGLCLKPLPCLETPLELQPNNLSTCFNKSAQFSWV